MNISFFRKYPLFTLLLFIFMLAGCSSTPSQAPTTQEIAKSSPTPPIRKMDIPYLGTVAVAEITLGHPSAKLMFKKDVVRSMTASSMMSHGGFRVIDWNRLKQVLFRRNLEWSDVVADKKQRRELKDVLLNDYFLVGSVSSYGERWDFQASAFNKNKTQIAKVQIDLHLKDAATNEIVSSVQGIGEAKRTVSQSLGFGAAGGSDPTLATNALNHAINNAISQMVTTVASSNRKAIATSATAPKIGEELSWIEVEGKAAAGSGKKMARKQALMDAYRKAIRKQKTAGKRMTRSSSNYFQRYEVVSEGIEGEDYLVKFRALVAPRSEMATDEEADFTDFFAQIGAPKLLFFLTEIKANKEKSSGIIFDLRSAEFAMAENFRKAGYEVLTSDDLLNRGVIREDELAVAREGLGGYAAEAGRKAGVDVVVAGTIKMESGSTGHQDIKAATGTVSLMVKAISPDSGRVLHTATKRQGFMSAQYASPLLAQEGAVATAVGFVAQEWVWDLPTLLAQDTRDVEMTILELDFQEVDKLKEHLTDVAGVEGVDTLNWSKESTRLLVKSAFTGPRETDLIKVLKKHYPQTSIEEVGHYRITVIIPPSAGSSSIDDF
jgi:curli biogenesis system outer membrane secretion channel CsgG